MKHPHDDSADLVPLGEAERTCRGRLGMSSAEFCRQLAEHARGRGGIPWVAGEKAVGVHRAALDELTRNAQRSPDREPADDE